MNNQNVFMIGWEYPPHNSGGLGVACKGLTEALSQDQTTIQFALPYHFSQGVDHMKIISCVDPTWEERLGQKVLYPPFASYSSDGVIRSFVTAKDSLSPEKLRLLPHSELEQRVQEYARVIGSRSGSIEKHTDVIHAHDWMSFPAAQTLKKKTGKPFIAHVHSTEYDRAGLNQGNHFISHIEHEGMTQADRVIAVSYYTKSLLVNKYGIDAQKIDVAHNGASSPESQPNPGNHHFAQKRPVVVFMGRLTLHKGVQYFIQLAQSVLASIPNALFIVAGSGDMYHELLLTSATRHLSASVLFSGFVRSEQRDTLLDRADVFVMPSISEPFGLVAVEAAQRHTPVIISKNAGVSEVLHGAVALDFWDLDKMTTAIKELILDPNYSRKVVSNQLNDLEHITWGNAATKVKQSYLRAILGK
ncbi:MAG: glycosyltransferase family 4 protein [Candidatus Pacebacteria bacterium]|nr:glycosyltransferase family 4 protein [Candidatus Paceibacterota bacterium]